MEHVAAHLELLMCDFDQKQKKQHLRGQVLKISILSLQIHIIPELFNFLFVCLDVSDVLASDRRMMCSIREFYLNVT